MTLREYLDRHLNHDTYCASWLYGSAFGQVLHNDHETRCNCLRREILTRWDNIEAELIDNSNNKEYKESSNNT